MPRPRKLRNPRTISVRLDEEEFRGLEELAKRKRKTISDLIRSAIANLLAEKGKTIKNESPKEIDFRTIGLMQEFWELRDELRKLQERIIYYTEKLQQLPEGLLEKYRSNLKKARKVLLRMGKVPIDIFQEYDELWGWLREAPTELAEKLEKTD